MNKRFVNVLHLSDLHFGAEHFKNDKGDVITTVTLKERDYILENLIETIKSIPQTWKPDVVAVSGDIGWRAHMDDYMQASIWFNKLSDGIGLSHENFIFCPGNHDIDRSEAEFSNSISSYNDSTKYLSEGKIHRRSSHFKNYVQFCKNFNISPLENSAVVDSDNLIKYLYGYRELYGVNFVVLNSAWCCKDNEDLGNLWIGEQLALDIQKSIGRDTSLKITLFHHPLNNMHITEQRVFNNEPITQDTILKFSDIILNGHVHGEIRAGSYLENKAYVFTSGATYKPNTYKLACQIIQVDINKYEYSTKVIYLPSASREWEVKDGEKNICFRVANGNNKSVCEKKPSAEYLLAKKYSAQGEEEYQNGNIEKAIKFYEDAEKIYRKLNYNLELFDVLASLSILQNILAKNYGKKAKVYEMETKDLLSKVIDDLAPKSLIKLGADASRRGNYELAREYYERVVDLCGEKEDYENLAEVFLLWGIMESKPELGGCIAAEHYFGLSMIEYERLGNNGGKARVFQSMGDVYRANKDYDFAIQSYKHAWELHQKTTDQRRKHFIRGELCRAYALAGQIQEAQKWKENILEQHEKMSEDSQARVHVQRCLDEVSSLL